MTEELPQVARVEPGEVSTALVTALYTGAVVSRVEAGVVALTGPGAVTSFQGLLTNDVELPGDGSFVYGALLTPKGMIVVDGWAARLGATVSYTVPAEWRGGRRPPAHLQAPGAAPRRPRGGRASAPKGTRRPSPRKCAWTRSAACRTRRAATPARRRSRGCTSAAT